jgi:cytochrome c oxidase assembly protein Cox11
MDYARSMFRLPVSARDLRIALACFGIVGAMAALVAFSLPLYRAFCEATGLGGTVRRAQSDTASVAERTVTVRFNADVAPGLPWRFGPNQRSVTVRLGEQVLVSFWAENLSDQPIIGHATYNVTPELAGQYFNKIQCFCFSEERLGPHQRVDMPVTFFVDPAMLQDRDVGGLPDITLSYTFFRSTAAAPTQDLARFGTSTVVVSVTAGDPARGVDLFAARCSACHALDHDKVGPRLGGLDGRPAGAVSGYHYSEALARAGLVWHRDTLERWLADPGQVVPGTRMAAAVPAPQERADLVAYLLAPPEAVATH